MQTCKPDSVFRYYRNPYHLSGLVITNKIYLPTLQLERVALCLQNKRAGIHGISSHRVYLVSLQHYLYILSVALVRPNKLGDGCYPLCYPVMSGLSSPPKRDDKAVCVAKIGYFVVNWQAKRFVLAPTAVIAC